MKQALLSALLFTFSFLSFGQCPTSPIVLSSQADVDNFTTNYPGCTELQNTLTISGADITDLSSLNVITSVFDLIIQDNPLLSNLNGLGNVVTINGYNEGAYYGLKIINNSNLTDISALINMSNDFNNIVESIDIVNNPLLSSLNGLQGMQNFIFFVYIYNNDSLVDLTGLNNVVSSDNFDVVGNDNLINLNGLDSINSALTIQNNSSLQNLIGLTSAFTGRINLFDNPNIQSLQGLEAVTSLSSFFLIGNQSLSDISAITAINYDSYYWFTIANNPNLSNCHISSICSALDFCGYNCDIIIENNSEGCNSIAQVAYNCGIVPSNDECSGALPLTFGETLEAYNELATASAETPSCNDIDRADVWFTFNSGSNTSIDILVDTGYSIQLWEGSCGSLTPVAGSCVEGSLLDFAVTINTDYYVQVWSACPGCRTTLTTGLFTILLQDGILSNPELAVNEVKVYPNPTKDILTINVTNSTINNIRVTDINGRVVLNEDARGVIDLEVDMSSLTVGMYFVNIMTSSGIKTVKVVKE